MRKLLVLFCLSTGAVLTVSAQDYCSEILEVVHRAIDRNDLKTALQKLQDAETCDYKDKLLSFRQQAQRKLFAAIEQQRADALADRQAALAARDRADQKALEAQSAALAAKAQETAAKDPTVALNLAMAAYRTAPTQQAVDALAFVLKDRRTVFYTSRQRFAVDEYSSSVVDSDFDELTRPFFFTSPDGSKLLLSFEEDDVSTILDLDQDEKPGVIALDTDYGWYDGYAEAAQQLAPDGSFVVLQWRNNPGEVIGLEGKNAGKSLLKWQGKDVKTFGLSPGGEKLLLIGKDTLKVWDTRELKYEKTISNIAGKYGAVWRGSISEDGQKLLAISEGDQLSLWQLTEQDTLISLSNRDYPGNQGKLTNIKYATFSPDGNRVAALTKDQRIHLFDIRSSGLHAISSIEQSWPDPTSQEIDLFKTLEEKIEKRFTPDLVSVAFSPDGSRLLTFSRYIFYDPSVKVWNVEDGQEVFSLRGLRGLNYSAAFTPDGKAITTSSAWINLVSGGDSIRFDPEIIHWELSPWQEPLAVAGSSDLKYYGFGMDRQSVMSLSDWETPRAYTRDSSRFYSADKAGLIKMWNTQTGAQLQSWNTGLEDITAIAVSPDGRYLAAGNEDGLAKLWALRNQKELASWDQLDNSLNIFADLAVYNTLQPEGKAIEDMDVIVNHIQFTPDNQRLLLATMDDATGVGLIRSWDIGTRTPLFTLSLPAGRYCEQLHYSPDGSRILSVDNSGNIQLWTDPIGSLKAGRIYRLSQEERREYGIMVKDY
jgi:WD40 repeat protein